MVTLYPQPAKANKWKDILVKTWDQHANVIVVITIRIWKWPHGAKRNFAYLYSDGLPAWNVDNTPSTTRSALFVNEGSEPSYNTILDNRDPRVAFTFFRSGDVAYQGPWVPKTSLGSRTAYAPKKGFSVADQTINGAATTDRILIRYAEVLLIYAEAKYELNGSISDADLNLSINLLRTRVGLLQTHQCICYHKIV
jgi:hypothetical protein